MESNVSEDTLTLAYKLLGIDNNLSSCRNYRVGVSKTDMSKKDYLSLITSFSNYEKLLLFALLVTCTALITQQFWINQSLVIKPGGPYSVDLLSDRASGGQSTVKWLKSDYYSWQCDIEEGYGYPYCLMQVLLNEADLSGFSQIRVGLKYEGPSETVRITLRNKNPIYSTGDDPETFKYNEVELSKQMLRSTVVLPLSAFRVADWWLRERKIAPEDSYLEIDNVVYLQILTGTEAPVGNYNFSLSSISLSGEVIPKETLYLTIIMGWVLLILGQLLFRLWYLKTTVEEHYQREQALIKLNRILNQKTRKFEKMASTDSLTELKNRAGISEFLIRQAKKYYSINQALSLIMIDIDHFKKINDEFGHDRGDRALKLIAKNLEDNIRETDGIGRWGGEEFMLVCPDTNLNSAVQLAEKLRQQIKSLKFSEDFRISCSFGVASFKNESIERFVKRADEALYTAKKNGRDQVVSN